HRSDRRSFRQPVAFVDGLSETRFNRGGQFSRQFFRAGGEKPQTAQLRRFRLSQISAQERRGCEHHSHAVLFHQLRDLFCFERVRISEGAHALEEWIEERDRAAEAVEERKGREQEIVFFG